MAEGSTKNNGALIFQCLRLLSARLLLVVPMWESVGMCLLINFSTKLMPSTEPVLWNRLQEWASYCPGPHTVQEGKTDECKEAEKKHKAMKWLAQRSTANQSQDQDQILLF